MTPAGDQALRMGLDLHLDTLLFTLAAAATGRDEVESAGVGRTGDGRPAPLDWQQWLVEDLETALTLVRDSARRDVPLPATLAGAGRPATRVRQDLVARYRGLVALLDDVIAAGADGRCPVRRTVGDLELLVRTEDHDRPLRRIRDLYAARLEALSASGRPVAAQPVAAS